MNCFQFEVGIFFPSSVNAVNTKKNKKQQQQSEWALFTVDI